MAIPPKLPELSDNTSVDNHHGGIAPTGKKIFFWIILAVLSVIFAEVTCYSSPYPFFDKWGLLVVLPLYGLHTLFLAGLILKNKSISLPILLLAGVLFGLYEAPITKVLWDPTWGGKETMIAGIAGLQTGVLTLFWHPWFAFILPLMVAELIFTSTDEILNTLPAFFQRWVKRPSGKIFSIILLAFFCGVNQGANTISIQSTLISTFEALGVFLLFALIWRIVSKNVRWRLRDLLPQGRELLIVGILLAALYGISLPLVRPEALPKNIYPYITIGAIYAFSIILLIRNVAKATNSDDSLHRVPQRFPWLLLLVFVSTYLLSSIFIFNTKPAANLVIIAAWGMGIIISIWVILHSLLSKKNHQ
ncbi:MAG: hypothetical protein ACYDH2_04330 [Anaerolineaceae bacterium]|nr:hypothetical protein [Anaerolineaceae bacterium]